MKIRPFKKGDENKVSQLVRDALRNHQYDFKECDQNLIEHDISVYNGTYILNLANRAELFVATSDEDNDLYGVACLDKDELHSCYTRGNMQKKGVGTALLNYVESIARERGVKKLHVHANFYTEPFYASCGFQLIKHTTVDFQGKIWPVVYMEKDLM